MEEKRINRERVKGKHLGYNEALNRSSPVQSEKRQSANRNESVGYEEVKNRGEESERR